MIESDGTAARDFDGQGAPVPRPTAEGTKRILENLGVSGRAAEAFVAEFNDNSFIKQIVEEGLLKRLYPTGIPGLH